jgi:hypothetical protein
MARARVNRRRARFTQFAWPPDRWEERSRHAFCASSRVVVWHRTLHGWARVWLRCALAMSMLTYGFVKVAFNR